MTIFAVVQFKGLEGGEPGQRRKVTELARGSYEKSEQLDVKPAEYFVVVPSAKSVPAKPVKNKALNARRCRPGSLRKVWLAIGS